jgi:hypothetical protein
MPQEEIKQQFFLLILALASQPITLETMYRLGEIRAKLRSSYRDFRLQFEDYATPLMMVELQNKVHRLAQEIDGLAQEIDGLTREIDGLTREIDT